MHRFFRLSLPALFLALAACGTAQAPTNDDGPTVESPIIGRDVVQVAMPTKGMTHPVHGKEAFLAVGPIEGVEGSPANGVATIHVFEDGTTFLGVQANINIPENGSIYEAWLAAEDGVPAILLGQLTNSFGDVRHSLRVEKNDDLRRFATILITKEPRDGNADSSGFIAAKGTLKPQKRD
jgi:hypothetical protein